MGVVFIIGIRDESGFFIGRSEWKLKRDTGRIVALFFAFFVLTSAILYIADFANRQRMVRFSKASLRESDGALNLVVMNGSSGYLGTSSVYLEYKDNGYITLRGSNLQKIDCFKRLSDFTLEPGVYTLTGLRGLNERTIALSLHLTNDSGFDEHYLQWHEDVQFTVETPTNAVLHIRVYPNTEEVDIIARPAVYKDHDNGVQ